MSSSQLLINHCKIGVTIARQQARIVEVLQRLLDVGKTQRDSFIQYLLPQFVAQRGCELFLDLPFKKQACILRRYSINHLILVVVKYHLTTLEANVSNHFMDILAFRFILEEERQFPYTCVQDVISRYLEGQTIPQDHFQLLDVRVILNQLNQCFLVRLREKERKQNINRD